MTNWRQRKSLKVRTSCLPTSLNNIGSTWRPRKWTMGSCWCTMLFFHPGPCGGKGGCVAWTHFEKLVIKDAVSKQEAWSTPKQPPTPPSAPQRPRLDETFCCSSGLQTTKLFLQTHRRILAHRACDPRSCDPRMQTHSREGGVAPSKKLPPPPQQAQRRGLATCGEPLLGETKGEAESDVKASYSKAWSCQSLLRGASFIADQQKKQSMTASDAISATC